MIDALKVLKALAGNDKVKVEIVRAGGITWILTAITKHQKQPIVCEIGCACIAALALRNPEHCQLTMQNNGAEVLVTTTGTDRRGRREGKVVEVLKRASTSIVGRYQEESGIGFVIPDNQRITHQILIPPNQTGGAVSGQIV